MDSRECCRWIVNRSIIRTECMLAYRNCDARQWTPSRTSRQHRECMINLVWFAKFQRTKETVVEVHTVIAVAVNGKGEQVWYGILNPELTAMWMNEGVERRQWPRTVLAATKTQNIIVFRKFGQGSCPSRNDPERHLWSTPYCVHIV